MLIFINENDALKQNTYKLPKEITNHLKNTLANFGQYKTNKGYKRLNTLIDPNYNNRNDISPQNKDEKFITYGDLKRIDHDFRHMEKNPNNLERILNGGELMAHFTHDILNRERNKVKDVLKNKKIATRKQNAVKPIVKPTTPVKPEKIQENKKIIFINEKQLNSFIDLLK